MVSITKPLGTAAVAAAGVAVARSPELRHRLRHWGDLGVRRVQYVAGGWPGVRYRLAGRQPDPDVDDGVLADRVRSSLGPLLKRLDLPHVHVMCEDHVVLLHGDVRDAVDAVAVEDAVRRVSGVAGVESYLHLGLLASDTQPSQGRAEASTQYRRMLAAVQGAGVPAGAETAVLRAVLATFSDVVPAGERHHLLAHLSPDLRRLAEPPRRSGRHGRVRSVGALVDVVGERVDGLTGETALAAARAVLGELRSMVPEERADVAAVLPPELRELWDGAA